MKFAKHIETVTDAWRVIDAVVDALVRSVYDLERAQGERFSCPLNTRRRIEALRVRIEALVQWEQERAVSRSDRRLNGMARRATDAFNSAEVMRRVSQRQKEKQCDSEQRLSRRVS